jgi:hypothetical protein
LAALAICACGCSSADHSTPAARASGPVSAEANGSASSDVSSQDAGSAAAAAAAPEPLVLQAVGGGPGQVQAEVVLLEPGVGPQQTCTAPVNAGACQMTTCKFGGIGSPAPGYGNFGTISASVGSTTVSLVYLFTGYPTAAFPSSVSLGPGDTMRFRGGNGADVPSFDVSATIPALAAITSPVATAEGGAPTIDTSRDLSVTWSPIAMGQVHFQLEGGDFSSGGFPVSVTCKFDGSTGTGVVPQTLLASLKDLSGTSPTYASLGSELDATTVVGGLTIETRSYPSSSGANYNFTVTLQ